VFCADARGAQAYVASREAGCSLPSVVQGAFEVFVGCQSGGRAQRCHCL